MSEEQRIRLNYTDNSTTNIDIALSTDELYKTLHSGTLAIINTPPEKRTMKTRLMRAGVKSFFMSFGDDLLTALYGPMHNRPGKQDDLVEWYTDELLRFLLKAMSSYTLKLSGSCDIRQGEGYEITVNARRCYPEQNAVPTPTGEL
jgi:hypothetical protein